MLRMAANRYLREKQAVSSPAATDILPMPYVEYTDAEAFGDFPFECRICCRCCIRRIVRLRFVLRIALLEQVAYLGKKLRLFCGNGRGRCGRIFFAGYADHEFHYEEYA